MICPLCQKNTNKIITKELRGGEKLPVFYCPRCDFGMLDLKMTAKNVKKYYEKKYRKIASPRLGCAASPIDLFKMAVPFQQDRLRLLKKHFSKNKRLLEVGCSAGMFLWHVRKHVKEVVGIDYDSRSAKFAAKKCGCRTYDTDIEKTNLEEGSFDIICAFQTLEHVQDPLRFIAKLKPYLKPNGIIAIEVPNLRDALVYALDSPAHKRFYYHVSHPWYFTEKSLRITMARNGFRGKVWFIQDYNFLNHMHWIFKNAPQLESLLGLSKPVFPCADDAPDKIKRELNRFIQDVDVSYKKKLSEMGVTSNLFFIGTHEK